MAGLFLNRRAFNLVASVYDQLTDQKIWAEQSRKVLSYVPSGTSPMRVLDIGCGPGGSTFALASALPPETEIWGVDYAEAMVQRACLHQNRKYSQYDQLRFQVGDATQLQFDDQFFDLIVGHSFLYLVPDPLAVLQELRRVLRPMGTAVLMEPVQGGRLWSAAKERFGVPEHTRKVTAQTLRFWTSMLTWRWFSTIEGRWDQDDLVTLFRRAQFSHVDTHPTLGGLGIHCVGRPR